MKSIKAWWFCPPNGKLAHGDGRIPKKGITHRINISKRPLKLYEHGLHASICIYDALYYAQYMENVHIVYRVELKGEMLEGKDQICAQKREYLSDGIDITDSIKKWYTLLRGDLNTIVLEDHPELNV